MYDNNFITACLNGDADTFDLDDYIDYWHENNTGITLREFLGLTPYEYEKWGINDDSIFRDIISCRMENIDFEDYFHMSPESRIAARSFDDEAINKLRNDSNE